MKQLTIRKNGKYYQAGYYEKGRWVQVKQLGTAEKVLFKMDAFDNITYQNKMRTKNL